MLKNTDKKYGTVAKFLHWFMAAIIIGMFVVAYSMMGMASGDLKWQLYGLHKSFGVTVLLLVFVRYFWRLLNVTPALAATLPVWQRGLAKFNILLLYALMLTMAGSGAAMSILGGHGINYFNLIEIPSFYVNKDLGSLFHELHEILSYVLIASFAFHVLAALYHHFVLKDDTLKRIWH